MAADLALSLAAPFLEYLITPVGRQCGYILFYRSYLRELEDGVDKLKDELVGIQHKCDSAKRNAMEIETKVTKWIDGVNGAVKEADTLLLGELQPGANTVIPLHDFQSWFKRSVCLDHPAVTLNTQQDVIPQDVELGARKRFFYLNPVVCYKKGRKAKKTMLVVQGLNEDKMNLGDIFFEAISSPILSAKDYETFGSRREIIDNIIKALGDEEAPPIGVWGMGGVGKSTLIKEVIRLAREKNLFDDVAMAVVSQNPDVKKIQGELAIWLGLKLKDDEHISGRAARLQKRLKPTNKMKSTAEPLETKKQDAVRPEENQDGMGFQLFQWKKSTAAPRVDVEEMDEKSTKPMVEGTSDVKQKQVLIVLDDIWREIDLEEIGIPLDGGVVKLLFTSRKQHVLSSEMGCSHNVFKLEVLKDEEPWRLFESIVGEIVTPDAQGKNKFLSIGKEVVEKCSGLPIILKAIATTLKNCSLPEWEDVLVQFKGSKDAYSNLEISYRHLESEELKSLFLVCALTNKASINVQDLLYYCMGLGLLATGTNTVRSARGKLKALLHDLQDSSLLLKDDEQNLDYVYIHDVVREVAVRIASRDEGSLLITDEFKLKKIPRKKLKNSKAISIPYVKFRKLPEGWECPELKMFLLYRRVDDPPIAISDSFFEGMKELSVLDITGRCFDSLSSSIQLLLNLNTLCLDCCSIEDLTIIGKLKQLQILTLRGSEIYRLPKEIGELSELKVLNLDNSKLEVIEPQVLGKLTSLEELHLKGSSFKRWEDEGEMLPSNAKVSELNHLSNLSIVTIHIHNPGTIPKHLEFTNLAEYIIQIGDVWDWAGDYKESRMLKIKLELCRSSFLHEKWVQDLLKRTQNLHLDGIKGLPIRSFHELCLDSFQELKHLHLQNSPLVQCVARSISKWDPCTAFTVLESLFLEKLTGLEMISRGPITANSFNKLKVIKVIECGNLKSLFSYSMLKCLSQLEEIEARDCEAMQVILTADSVATNTDQVVKLEALHRIELHNLPNLMRFCSSHKVEVDQTEGVKGRSSEIVQEDPCIRTSCTMFSNDKLVSFPVLKSLILSSLPKLKYIWQNNCPVDHVSNMECLEVSCCDDLLIVIPSSLVKEVTKLETLTVRDCGSLQEIFKTSDGDALNLTGDVDILSRLKNLELSNLPFLRCIWENNHQLEKVRAFQNLNSLKVVNCCSLMNILPAAFLKSLNQLREICVKSCKEMKSFVSPENDGRSGETNNIVFQSLTYVFLEDLPNMVTFVWTKRGVSINFPSMEEMYVKKCPNMISFCLVKEDESDPELCFFDDKVLLPKLAILFLKSMRSIQNIWCEEILEESFCQLEKLYVLDCQALVDVIPFINRKTTTGIGRLQFHNLKEINISHCTSLEGPIFKIAVEEEMGNKEYTHKGDYYCLFQLEKLWLSDLPKLEHVVQPDSHVVVGFPSLVDITVIDCECVIELFPIATAATLSKFENLHILRCNSMTQIFGNSEEEEDEMLDSISFPRLHSIFVTKMDSLISIFLGISCMLGFPSLEALEISWCSKLKTFSQSHINEEGVHYLFDDKVEFPNLKKMLFYDLSTLQRVWKTKLPCLNICDRIGQITEINIWKCENLEEFIFESDDNAKNEDPAVFHSLTSVKLGDLPNMVAFIRGMKRDQFISFPCLKELYVLRCPKMRAFYLPPNTKESGCGSLLPLCPFFDRKVLVPKVVKLDLISMGSIEKIWHGEIFEESCLHLEKLHVKDCQNLVKVFPSKYVTQTQRLLLFQNVKEIIITECSSLEGSLFEFVWEEGEEKGNQSFSLPLRLEKLWLYNLPKLEHLVHPISDVVLEFRSLVDISIGDCKCLIDVFPIATAETLLKLEEVQIQSCSSMIYVFGKVEETEEEEDEMLLDLIISFPCLRTICVQHMNSLICFFLGTASRVDFPSLDDLEISWCPILKTFVQRHKNENFHYLFDEKVELPNLKKVVMRDLSTLQTIWKTKLPCLSICDRIGQMSDITIQNCESLEEIIFESDDGEKEIKVVTNDDPAVFQSLANVLLENLPNMVAFIRGMRRDQSINFPSLKELNVLNCQKMRAFYLTPHTEESGGESLLPLCSFFDYKVLVPKVVKLDLISAGSIEKIWHEEIFEQSCVQLEKLYVRDCQNLVKVFPSKYVTRTHRLLLFQNLKEIIISECNSLEGSLFEFVWEGEEKGEQVFSLPQLEKVWLFSLPKLEHVIHPTPDAFVEFESLVEISIGDCHCLIDLLPSATTSKLFKLEKVQIFGCNSMRYVFGKEEEAEEEEDEDEILDVISFPCLRFIQVQMLNSLICFFLGTARQLDFPSLEDLQILLCPVLKTFVQRHKTKDIHYLFDNKVVFPNLEKIKLFQLSSLETIWKNDELVPSNSDSCTRLKSLTVSECKDLQYTLPASFAGNLAQLEELCIYSCEALEEIVMQGDDYGSSEELDGKNSSQKFFFPQVNNLILYDLPNLKSFFRGSNACTWSALKKVWMWHCNKVQIFTTKFSSMNNENSIARQCLFSAEQVIPKLEKLCLIEEDEIMIQDGDFKEDIFTELKHFSLACFHNQSAAGFPSRFMLANNFQKLERLYVFCSSFEEIFADESLSPQEIVSYRKEKPLASLRELKLAELHNLKHVWEADMTVFAEILKNIQLLEVTDCPALKSLFHTASCSFGNLKTIKVNDCTGMQELLTTSAATSLVKLTQLDIYDCGMIGAIVSPDESKPAAAEEEEEDGELLVICFRELKHIGLHRLPSLSSFSSSANCIFELPSLEEVIVIKCPNLKVFSSNNVVAPKLSKVLLTEKEQEGQVCWDGDLNTTIQNLPK